MRRPLFVCEKIGKRFTINYGLIKYTMGYLEESDVQGNMVTRIMFVVRLRKASF